MIHCGKWQRLYIKVEAWQTQCNAMGWHQPQTETKANAKQIESLALTGHLSHCVCVIDSDGTNDQDLEDIVHKYTGNEQVFDSSAEMTHSPMPEKV